MPESIPDLCILFAYHKVDALTLHHLNLIKKHSNGYPVIPLTDDVAEHLPGGVDVKDFPDLWPKTNAWRRCDTMLYRWFLNRVLTARRYLLLEYDVLCNIDLREAYAAVWDADIAARDLYLPEVKRTTRFGKEIPDDWHWFKEIGQLPEADRPYAAGLVPLVGILFSHRGLEAVVKHVTTRDVFCELRIGTAARKAGLEIREFPSPLRDGIRWDVHVLVPEGEGLFHSVKSIANPLPTKFDLNLAINRPATQSSVSQWSRKKTPSEDAAGANNGLIDGQYGFHTNLERDPWWQVDLESPCELSQIKLYNRLDVPNRLSRFKILGSVDGMNWSCLVHKADDSVWGGQTLEPFKADFVPRPRARFVRVVLDGFNLLHFCECEILGERLAPSVCSEQWAGCSVKAQERTISQPAVSRENSDVVRKDLMGPSMPEISQTVVEMVSLLIQQQPSLAPTIESLAVIAQGKLKDDAELLDSLYRDLLAKSKAQLRQDLFALAELNFKRNGYFVEFGATNGIDLSNTYLLEKEFAWNGILAEPARIWHGALRVNRSANIETKCVWRDSHSILSFNEVAVAELSTIDLFSASDGHSGTRKRGNTYEVETISLLDLLRKFNAPNRIDYLSIDTEGSELEILENFDFSEYQFSVITCEHNGTSNREKIFALLTQHGYTRKYQQISRWDDWYVKRT